MIELLTPPVPADPAVPASSGTALGDSAMPDFAALLGDAGPAAAALVPVSLAVAAIPLAAEEVTPAVVALPAAPAVAAPVAPVPAIAALAAAAPIADGTEATSAPETEPEPVKLPTLPTGFFAQKLPPKAARSEAKLAATTGDDTEESSQPDEGDTSAPVATTATDPTAPAPAAVAPNPAACAAVAPPAPAVVFPAPNADAAPVATSSTPAAVPAATAAQSAPPVIAAEHAAKRPLIFRVAQEGATARPATGEIARADLATPAADQPAPDPIAAPVEQAAPDLAPLSAASQSTAPAVPAFADAFAVQQPAALAPQPQAIATPAVSTAVALDDLMVAGASDSAWLDRLATDITTLATGDSREATLRITPRSLGDMTIKLEVEDHRARVHFTVDTPQALSLMADGAPRLAQLVEANGFKLDGATVDLSQRRDGRDASGQQQQQQAQDQPRGRPHLRDEIAARVARTRVATATERFA